MEKGLFYERKIADINLQVKYQPKEIVFKNRLDEIPKNDIIYFSIKMTPMNGSIMNHSTYKFLSDMSFAIENHVFAIGGNNDTIYPVDFIYPRLYGASNSIDMLVAFDASSLNRYPDFVLSVNKIGNSIGNNKFRFNVSDINDAPTNSHNLL